MAKYMTPDFDVTVYEIEDRITYTAGSGMDGDGLSYQYSGDLNPEE